MKPRSRHAGTVAPEPALLDGRHAWSTTALQAEVQRLTELMRTAGTRVLATLIDNSAAWVVADLAAAQAGIVHMPLPTFWTRSQSAQALATASADGLLTSLAVAQTVSGGLAGTQCSVMRRCVVAGDVLALMELKGPDGPKAAPLVAPCGTARIFFTAGSTGRPKGVCLSQATLQQSAAGVAQATQPLGLARHLCALPLGLQIEHVAGLLAAGARRGTCIVPPLDQVGFTGPARFDPAVFQAALLRHEPDSVVLLPSMLQAWAAHLHASRQLAPRALKLVLVSGAAVGERTLMEAHAAGIPAYEGYGLAEAGTLLTLNLPGADLPGSVGRALPHAQLRCSADGEIEVAGPLFLGYLGASHAAPAWWPTGDLGRIDAHGFVHVTGRKQHVLRTACGRQVSPEWVETVLRVEPAIAHATVFSDGQCQLSAVLWPSASQISDASLEAAVRSANRTLPEHARLARWTRARIAFNAEAGERSRPARAAIERLHAPALTGAATPSIH